MPLTLVPPSPARSPYYRVRGTHLGQYINRSTKTGRGSLARRVLKQIERDIERGRFAEQEGPSFAAGAIAYMNAGGDRRFLPKLIRYFAFNPATGKPYLLSHINQIVVDTAAGHLYPGATAPTLNRQVYTPISAILKRSGLNHPVARPKGWRGRKLTHWLTPEIAFRVFSATTRIGAPKEIRLQFRIYLTMLCYTGMRRSEPLRLHCRDVDLTRATALLVTSKNEKPRLVHLPPIVVEELRLLPAGLDRDALVFDLTVTRLRTLWGMTLRAAGVTLPRRVAFHVFCHTWATWMRREGLNTFDLTKTGRWAGEESADRYAHVVIDEIARTADRLPVDPAQKRRA